MLHVSNLYHLIYAVAAWFVIQAYLGSSRVTRFRTIMRLLQITPLFFAIDLIVGFTLIDRLYGTHQSATWISRSAMIFPGMFVLSFWLTFRKKADKKLK